MITKMQQFQAKNSIGKFGLHGLVTMAAIALTFFITINIPYLISAIVCSIVISFLASASIHEAHPKVWWGSLGAIAGCILGTSFGLSETLSQLGLSSREMLRYTVIGSLALSGLITGILLSRNLGKAVKLPQPKEVILATSALTAGAFGVIVSIRFAMEGLDEARVLSSRLSTMTTILVSTMALPGYIGYQLGRLLTARFGHGKDQTQG